MIHSNSPLWAVLELRGKMLPYIKLFSIDIPMYGLLMAAGFLLCSFWSYRRAEKRGLQGENLIIIAAMIIGVALFGGILLYDLITYTPAEMAEYIRTGHLEYILRGGIVFYGALIGGAIGAFLGSLIAKDDIRNYLDVIIPTIPVGHALGRIGCFCAGCCYGAPTDSFLGVIYPEGAVGAPAGIPLLPVQLFEAAGDIIIAIILIIISKKTISRYLTAIVYCMAYGIMRFVLEFFRYDSIRGQAAGLSTSQWISIALIAGALVLMLISRKSRKKDPDGI